MAGSSHDHGSVEEGREAHSAAPAPLPSIEQILADPAASYWLKAAIRTLIDRDPVDALNDALVLAAVLDARLRAVLGLERHPADSDDEER